MSMNFLRADGSANMPVGRDTGWRALWLPSLRQMGDALQFQVGDAVGPEIHEDQPVVAGLHTTMQQGLGMVIATGIVAGALPFLINLIRATAAGTSLQMLAIAEFATQRTRLWSILGLDPALMSDVFQQIAGMSPRAPGFLTAFFSAAGVSINIPLNFLTLWIAYGAGVLVVAHFVGAKTTLQRFFATTAYAFLPLALTVLSPLPWFGGLFALLSLLGFFLLYVRAVRTATGLETAKAAIATLLPGAIFACLLLIAVGMFAGSLIVR